MQTFRQQRRAQRKRFEQLAEQMRLEKNGAPIPGDIAEHMTKPKQHDQLWQAFVDVKGEPLPMAVSPKAGEDFVGMIVTELNKQICSGKRPGWSMARLEPCAILRS